MNQIGIAIILQTFFTSSRAANILGYAISTASQFISLAVNAQFFAPPHEMTIASALIPHLTFSRFYYLLSKKCLDDRCPLTFDQMPDEMTRIVYYLAASSILLLASGIYLNLWINNEKGTSFLRTHIHPAVISKSSSNQYSIVSGIQEDDDSFSDPSKYAVLVKDLHKVYFRDDKPFNALKGVSLKLKKGQVLGLLGPNGAGKSTLLSILTGMTLSTKGKAWVAGFDVSSDLPEVYKRIGVCPQFDLLWEDLTPQEHLMFYARLKGADEALDSSIVDKTLRKVNLEKEAHKLAKQLSGGQKRRLSLAIALIGDPSVIILDEPTTGLDPLNREELWKILEAVREHTSVIVTTHLMQEAEYLSDVIGNGYLTQL